MEVVSSAFFLYHRCIQSCWWCQAKPMGEKEVTLRTEAWSGHLWMCVEWHWSISFSQEVSGRKGQLTWRNFHSANSCQVFKWQALPSYLDVCIYILSLKCSVLKVQVHCLLTTFSAQCLAWERHFRVEGSGRRGLFSEGLPCPFLAVNLHNSRVRWAHWLPTVFLCDPGWVFDFPKVLSSNMAVETFPVLNWLLKLFMTTILGSILEKKTHSKQISRKT